jgi:hypothetical protein
MWILELWPCNYFSGSICFEFSVLVLCSACTFLSCKPMQLASFFQLVYLSLYSFHPALDTAGGLSQSGTQDSGPGQHGIQLKRSAHESGPDQLQKRSLLQQYNAAPNTIVTGPYQPWRQDQDLIFTVVFIIILRIL